MFHSFQYDSQSFNPVCFLYSTDDTVGFVVPCRKGGYIAGIGRWFCHVDLDSKKVTKLQEVDQGKETQLNDGKCDPRGRVWAGKTVMFILSLSAIDLNLEFLYTYRIILHKHATQVFDDYTAVIELIMTINGI